RIKSTVPLLTTHTAAYSCLVCMAVFFYLIDHLGKSLRPSGALRVVAWVGRRVVERVYPRPSADLLETPSSEVAEILSGHPTVTIPSSKDGVVLAFDEAGLVALAQRADCVIEMVPQVGDHVAVGDLLFRVFRGGATMPTEALCHSIAVG